MSSCALFFLSLLTFCHAWLPADKNLTLFATTTSKDSDSHPHQDLRRWLPASGKIRGVNLGSLFIVEPWMANDEWNAMGCGGTASEFDCVSKLGQDAADAAFQTHWGSWITQQDLVNMLDLGLNTIRVPVGYWMREDIVFADSEHFPRGGLAYLEQLVGWASDAGFYIILDLHGAPGAQVAQNADTGQNASSPGFYVSWQYERAYKFLEWMTTIIHTNSSFRNVGMIEVLNEPIQNSPLDTTMISEYYPTAWARIRAAEDTLNITPNNRLHIQMMNEKWGSGNPNQNLADLTSAAYDDHRYIKWAYPPLPPTRAAYLAASCADDRGGNWPVVVGEWSLSVDDGAQNGTEFGLAQPGAVAWYARWWAAQVLAYERQAGWIFWSWRANWIGGQDDWRWSYLAAFQAGAIPKDPNQAYAMDPCNGVSRHDVEEHKQSVLQG